MEQTPSPAQGTSPDQAANHDVSGYILIKRILFAAYFVALVVTLSGISQIPGKGDGGFAEAFLILFLIGADVMVTIIFFIGLSATFKNASRTYYAQEFNIGTVPTEEEARKPARFITIPYLLVTIPGLISRFMYDIQASGGAIGQRIYAAYTSHLLLDVIFQALFLLSIPYTIVKIVIWAYARLSKKPAAAPAGNPDAFLKPNPIAIILLFGLLAAWVFFLRIFPNL